MAARNNPMFQQLKVMFPNLDNTVLYSVWQSTNESIDEAIEVLLSFNDSSRSMRASQTVESPPGLEARLAERENAQYLLTPSGIIDPITNKYFGDYIQQMQYKSKKKKKNRLMSTAATTASTASTAAGSPSAHAKKTRWIPLEEYTSEKIHDEWLQTQRKGQRSRNRRRRRAAAHRTAEEPHLKVENPFSPLEAFPVEVEPPQDWEAEEPAQLPAFGSEPTDDELQPLLLGEPVKLSGFLPCAPVEVAEPAPVYAPVESAQFSANEALQASVERDLASYAWSMDDSYVWLTGSAEQPFLEPALIDENEPDWEVEAENVPDQAPEPEPEVPLIESLSLSTLLAEREQAVSCVVPVAEPRSEQQWIVVKLYLDAGNIHRFSFARDQLSFERLQERVAHNLLQRADSPADCRAYAVTYEDDEGDRIAVCSQEELCEALRVHEECIWPVLPAGELPILRLHVRPVAVGHAALNQGYIIA